MKTQVAVLCQSSADGHGWAGQHDDLNWDWCLIPIDSTEMIRGRQCHLIAWTPTAEADPRFDAALEECRSSVSWLQLKRGAWVGECDARDTPAVGPSA